MTLEKEQAITLSMIDKVRKCKVDADLYISAQKILEREIEGLYTKLGKNALTQSDANSDEAIAEEIEEKEAELKQITSEDDEADKTDLRETARQLAQYLIDAAKAGETQQTQDNPIVQQIMPLMSSVAGETLVTLLGPQLAAYLLVSNVTRNAIIFSMTAGFLLFKLMSKHGMKITTTETPMTDQEIENIMQAAKAQEEMALKAISQGLGLDLPSGDDEAN